MFLFGIGSGVSQSGGCKLLLMVMMGFYIYIEGIVLFIYCLCVHDRHSFNYFIDSHVDSNIFEILIIKLNNNSLV